MLSHRQGWSFAALFLIFPRVFFAGTTSDAPPASFRAGTSEVRVSFFATDENNHLVETIERNDFAIVDDDMIIREFRSLARSNETALDITVLVDASESVAPQFEKVTRSVLHLMSPESHPASDEISVVAFAGLRPLVLCTSNCGDARSEQKLLSLKAGGPTPLFDSLAFAARTTASRRVPGKRQVLILFSDGNDNISVMSRRTALDALTTSNALLYTVDLRPPGCLSDGSVALQEIAEATGGRRFSMQDDTANILQAVLADLRASYVVTYPLPRRTAGFHSLRILPKHNLNLRFHCRRGYFYEEGH